MNIPDSDDDDDYDDDDGRDIVVPFLQVVTDASDTSVKPDLVYTDLSESPNILTKGRTWVMILTLVDSLEHEPKKLHMVTWIV